MLFRGVQASEYRGHPGSLGLVIERACARGQGVDCNLGLQLSPHEHPKLMATLVCFHG